MRKENRNLKQANSRTYHLMLLPAVILVIIFNYGPMAGLVMAFQDFSPRKGFFGSDFVGLENFRYIFSLPNLWQVVGNTLLISVFKILGKGRESRRFLPSEWRTCSCAGDKKMVQ